MRKHTCTVCHKDFNDDVTEDHYTQYPRGSKYGDVVVDDVPWMCKNCSVTASIVTTGR